MRNTLPAGLFQHYKGRNAWDLPMADNGYVLLTHKYIGIQTVRFYFSLKGLMEGLNKLCLSIYLRPRISKHTWANSIAASRSRSRLKTYNPKPMGDHSHKQWYALTVALSYFHPLHQSKPPVFYPKLSPKVLYFFPHCPKFWKFFTQRPQIGWNLRKKVMSSIFMAFVTERPLFLALHAHV